MRVSTINSLYIYHSLTRSRFDSCLFDYTLNYTIMKKGTKVKTWLSDEVGTVVDYNPHTNEVTVKYNGSAGVCVCPLGMCTFI